MGVQSISISQSLANALNAAGNRSGVDFDYLLQTAMRESSLNPQARASTSSAVGLFQFLEGTWLQVMKEEGPRLGYQSYADAIARTSNGDYVVADAAKREQILQLRENPQIAADLAAAFTRSNGDYLRSQFGRMPSAGELYIAHFLGAQGAERMFKAGLENPEQIAVQLFPRQAAANRAIFFDGSGQARTIRQVYQVLVAKHEAPDNAGFAVQQMTSGSDQGAPQVSEPPLPSRFSPANMSFTGLFKNEIEEEQEAGQESSAFFTQLYAQ
ncbi:MULTISPECIES: transglycosylase SLT domain-containing protein [Devosia]|uniref:transglycosylase SLT domain-containing protein n=1 Tax=Devosia TaxID=46913 RepID=UPI000CE96389|nr:MULTISPECIES: transglycosylase SLT domain-containing protein [Devosia]AVF05051.1 hypothetical protein C4375_15970 [Devosia sp. I507]